MLEERVSRGKEQGTSRALFSARYANEPFLNKRIEDTIAIDTADSGDIGARDRLLVGDNRQRFKRGRGQLDAHLPGIKLLNPLRIFGTGAELIPVRDFHEVETPMQRLIVAAQFSEPVSDVARG